MRFLSCFCPQYAEVYPSLFENAIRACAADMTKRQIQQAEPRLRCCRRHTLTQIREKRNTKRSCLPKCNVIQLLQSQPTPKPKPKLSHSPSPSPSQCQCQCQLIAANCCCCCCCCYGYCCCCPGAAMVIAQSTPATTDQRTTVETCKMRLGCCWLKYISVKVARDGSARTTRRMSNLLIVTLSHVVAPVQDQKHFYSLPAS